MHRILRTLLALVCLVPAARSQTVTREQAQQALHKAVEFYRTKVSTHGGYHFAYTEDLSYGRSEQSETPHHVEVQRDGTPLVGMTYLDAYEATGDRFYLEAARATANMLVQGQLCSGGWDYSTDFDPARRKEYPYRAEGNCDGQAKRRQVTTLDDNVTQACVRLMMRVDRELKFQDPKIHEATLFALDSLVKAQYPNGAWPQRFSSFPNPAEFPVKRASYPETWQRTWPGGNYQGHYTFNDNSIVDMIDAMLEAARIYNEPRYRAAAEKGGGFILLAQMPDPQPGWAQQYDRDMHPAWARRFEPPSMTGGESLSVMKMLLVLYRETGDRKYLEPLPRALDYYRRSVLPPVGNPSEIRRRACPPGSVCLARFYELKTNKPLYITKGTRVTVTGGPAAILDGYEVSYSDESVITHYGVLTRGDRLNNIADEYESIKSADRGKLRRGDKLHGLSPWSADWTPVGAGREGMRRDPRSLSRGELESRVRTMIANMDPRGAWVEDGSIGKSDRVVSVFAAKDMVVTLAGKTMPMRENDTLEIFSGRETPRQRIIRSRTFADNVEALCAFLTAAK